MTSPAATKPLYQQEESLRTHVARITSVRSFQLLSDAEKALFKTGGDETCVIEANETIFYAQGGGQPFDTGLMASLGQQQHAGTDFMVEAVRNGSDGRILHFGHFSAGRKDTLKEGDMVEQRIDATRRDLNSRIHTGGHIIALAVRRLVEKTAELEVTELKAQHYPDACFVEFKGVIDNKHKDAIQDQATKYVKNALPVKLNWYDPEELGASGAITAEGMPIIAGIDGKVRVVDVVGAGAYPCGGTHVQDTSLVGQLVVKSIKRQKGNSKISYSVQDGEQA
ncbi:hypothetical protein B0A50_00147 [Salinomyces thailandicus]|uniref:Alanyl-transfer RNA synthetases family profile domain-containing protein n=1 Tax=Salinomyces thailandicus TaxID=706561 RepID=A0A4U0UFR4_9PEZI|nr:hypothetical protein B0A50_00147 [Salinomyces thailandica]